MDYRLEKAMGGQDARLRRGEVNGDFRCRFVTCTVSVSLHGAGPCFAVFRISLFVDLFFSNRARQGLSLNLFYEGFRYVR